jgi:hypothetical protein
MSGYKATDVKATVENASRPGNADPQLGFKSKRENAKAKDAKPGFGAPGRKRKAAKLGLVDPRIGSISKLAESISALNRQAVKEYTPLAACRAYKWA